MARDTSQNRVLYMNELIFTKIHSVMIVTRFSKKSTLKEYRTSEFIVTYCRRLNKRILFPLLVVLFPLYIFSQNITISGKVLNAENKEIMPGVNIRLCQKDSLVSVCNLHIERLQDRYETCLLSETLWNVRKLFAVSR